MVLLTTVFSGVIKPFYAVLIQPNIFIITYGLMRVGIPVRCSSNRFNINESVCG
jgi:hypothetical protein